ncbi:metal-dependent hydrolase [Mucilaginibacter ginsenosidivorax]|uniref:Metal-dependent hydrolase n=1 Tax=Mucilaginibacter ginsenosidivorax TaxID=862126 RepID=A0A5B8VVF1_9SPHI|nr:metal-dependent hydrolase [Mucilaginibacter ginsenosidivorax]QEC74842.1 metal-dependent hydrolase [Mucilaginibacter ginsenosidivorax]
MDSVTHITLGACIGELVLGKKLGKQALMWGAIAQSLPDIDSAGALFLSPEQALLAHRGITHSLVFALVVGLALAFLVRRIHHKVYVPFVTLALFFCLQLMLHDLLDTCNAYGTGLLEPFSHQRFSVNLLYVADPLFTTGLLVAFVVLVFKNIRYQGRAKWAFVAIALSGLYLCLAVFSKLYISGRVQATLKKDGVQPGYLITPAPFTSMLWYIVAPVNNGYNTAYSSVFDGNANGIAYQFHAKNDSLLNGVQNKNVVNSLVTFSDKYYTITKAGNDININVLRFGQVQGWAVADAQFAFSYPLIAGKNQAMLLQKGRLSGWNGHALKIYVKRILGKSVIENKPNHKI